MRFAVLSIIGFVAFTAVPAGGADPWAVLTPCIAMSAADRAAVVKGNMVSRVLPSSDRQIAVFATTRVNSTPEVLAEAARNITELKKSTLVVSSRQFSDPPQLSDLDTLVLASRDLETLAACKRGDCGFKLTAQEIDVIVAAQGRGPGRDRALTDAFRRVLLDRVLAYRSSGLAGLAPIANRSDPHRLGQTMAELQAESPCVLQSGTIGEWLRAYPHHRGRVESFIYWSQELYSGRPAILVTHVAIEQSPNQALVIGKQIFASRYFDGGIALMSITTDADGARYLSYLNRSSVDLLGGFLGPIRRAIVESRVSGELPDIITKLRGRLERSTNVTRPDSLRLH
jgi:hypothetical protein